MPGRDRGSVELKAVAPLVAVVGDQRELLGPVMLVENAGKTVAVTSAEIVRAHHDATLLVLTQLDGSRHVAVTGIGMGRYAGLGMLDLAENVPAGSDVIALTIDRVCATSDTRGAPAGLVTIVASDAGYERIVIGVHIDSDDGGGMSDTVTRLASPLDAAHVGLEVEGAPLFAWFPPDPALGRSSEVLAVALAYPYRAQIAKPRSLPVIAELVELDDLGRALISIQDHDTRPELAQVAGEIVDKEPRDPLAGLDD